MLELAMSARTWLVAALEERAVIVQNRCVDQSIPNVEVADELGARRRGVADVREGSGVADVPEVDPVEAAEPIR